MISIGRCLLILGFASVWCGIARAEITLLGEVQVAGEETDQSGLSGTLEDGVPLNRFGGIGAIDHLEGHLYVLQPDRGPDDGAVPYPTRFHLATLEIPATGSEIQFQLKETHLLQKASGAALLGASRILTTDADQPSRLDPEGVRVIRREGQKPQLAISDEYGPRIDLFDLTGRRTQELLIPDRFLIDYPSGDAKAEARENAKGRQPNNGFESLAISPDGTTLLTMIQRPLIQDGALDDGKNAGLLNRILRIDIASHTSTEILYPLDSPDAVVSEMLCVDDHLALVLERDSLAGREARVKRIALIDIRRASDISQVDAIPALPEDLPTHIRCVSKRAFLDLLDPRFGIAGKSAPAKFEGLTFGPDLPDGRRTLLVTVDNDFKPKEPTRIYVFAIPTTEFAL